MSLQKWMARALRAETRARRAERRALLAESVAKAAMKRLSDADLEELRREVGGSDDDDQGRAC